MQLVGLGHIRNYVCDIDCRLQDTLEVSLGILQALWNGHHAEVRDRVIESGLLVLLQSLLLLLFLLFQQVFFVGVAQQYIFLNGRDGLLVLALGFKGQVELCLLNGDSLELELLSLRVWLNQKRGGGHLVVLGKQSDPQELVLEPSIAQLNDPLVIALRQLVQLLVYLLHLAHLLNKQLLSLRLLLLCFHSFHLSLSLSLLLARHCYD